MSSNIELRSEIACMPVIGSVGFPLAVNINMFFGGRNRLAGCNLRITVGTPCIACVARFTAGCNFGIAYFCVLVIRSIYFAVLNTANRAYSFCNTGCLAAAVLSFIN